jgi:uncharacterized protein YjbJ (UPF0337 family)
MSIWERAKGKVDELVGRAEEVYGQSHGDAAAQLHGEAHRLEGEAEVHRRESEAEVHRREGEGEAPRVETGTGVEAAGREPATGGTVADTRRDDGGNPDH